MNLNIENVSVKMFGGVYTFNTYMYLIIT